MSMSLMINSSGIIIGAFPKPIEWYFSYKKKVRTLDDWAWNRRGKITNGERK